MTLDDFKARLRDRLANTDIEQVKEDVAPFIDDLRQLDFWSNDYFLQLADHMNIING